MATQTDRTSIRGVTLVRHYDDQRGSVDEQCGPIHWYQSFLDELLVVPVGYYSLSDGTNKFGSKVTLNVYGTYSPYPADTTQFFGGNPLTEAMCCYPIGGGLSRIDARWLGIENLVYRMPACLSHEFGHAYQNWCEAGHDSRLADVWAHWVRVLHSGSNSTTELFANAFRVLRGTHETRGVSGPGSREPMEAGAVNPNDHPEWAKQIDLMPELCAYIQAYGCKPGTLSWQGGADGYWQLQNNDGVWMKQESYYKWSAWTCTWEWWRWAWSCKWEPRYPTYNRS